MIRIIYTSIFIFVSTFSFCQNYEAKLLIDNDLNTATLLMQVVASGNVIPSGSNITTISMKLIGASNITSLSSTAYTMQAPDLDDIINASSTSNPSPDTWTPGVWITVAVYNLDPANNPYSITDIDITSQGMASNSTEIPTMSATVAGGFNQIVEPQTTMLPIILSKFNASPSNKNTNVTWTTSSEINGSHFEVERSSDARNWDYLSSVEAAGESSKAINYDYVDINAAKYTNTDQALYYRLKMVDRDGSYEYSDTRTVQFEKGKTSFRVFPNPTAQEVTVALQGYEIDNQTKLSIFDVTGKMVVSSRVQSANQKLDLKSMGLAPGVYQVMLMQDGIVVDNLSIAIVE